MCWRDAPLPPPTLPLPRPAQVAYSEPLPPRCAARAGARYNVTYSLETPWLAGAGRMAVSVDRAVVVADVDECAAPRAHECGELVDHCVAAAACVNTVGSYTCRCPPNHPGDGMWNGTGCQDATPPRLTCVGVGCAPKRFAATVQELVSLDGSAPHTAATAAAAAATVAASDANATTAADAAISDAERLALERAAYFFELPFDERLDFVDAALRSALARERAAGVRGDLLFCEAGWRGAVWRTRIALLQQQRARRDCELRLGTSMGLSVNKAKHVTVNDKDGRLAEPQNGNTLVFLYVQ